MPLPLTPEKAQARLEDMCARAEHCTGELMQKLRLWGIAPADAERIIGSLKERRFVDDERFARAYVRDKFRFAGWGPRKISMGLAAKRLPRAIIDSALAEIDPAELQDHLLRALRSKLRLQPDLITTYEGRTKLYRFALQRGFPSASISAALRTLLPK